MIKSRRSTAALAALTLSLGAAVFTATPAQAADPVDPGTGGGGGAPPVVTRTITFSAPSFGPGESITWTVTAATSVMTCSYVDGVLNRIFDFTDNRVVESGPFTHEYLSSVLGGPSDLSIYLLDAVSPVSCPDSAAEAADIALSSASLSMGVVSTPTPTPVATPVAETLAKTGQNPAGLLGLVAVLATAGVGMLAVRRRTAKS